MSTGRLDAAAQCAESISLLANALARKPVQAPLASASRLRLLSCAQAKKLRSATLRTLRSAISGCSTMPDGLGASADLRIGLTALRVPQAAAGRQVRAVLRARSGKTDSVASVELTVLPGALQSGYFRNSARAARNACDEFSRQRFHRAMRLPSESGERTAMPGFRSATRPETLLEQGDMPASQNAVTLTAPAVTGPTTYYVVATITQGIGEQTVVRRIAFCHASTPGGRMFPPGVKAVGVGKTRSFGEMR